MKNQDILSPKQLLISGLSCLILAIVVVVLFVLPAEYGEDITQFGKSTGLTKLSKTSSDTSNANIKETSEPSMASSDHYRFIDPQTAEVSYDWAGDPEPVLLGNNHKQQSAAYKTDSIEIRLEAGAMTEYKAIMNEGESLVYSWSANQKLYADFHAHVDTGNPDFFTRYSEFESSEDHGSIVAPYTGQHGWFWLNTSDQEVIIQLRISGFYDELVKFDLEAE